MNMIIELKEIYKDYYQDKLTTPVLRNINFSVEEGEYLAIMGPSGSGKTTLMNIIGLLDVPTSGTYLLSGEDVSKRTDAQMAKIRNKKIGFVFQQFNLLPKLTALDNVALPLLYAKVPRAKREEMAQAALDKVGIGDKAGSYPTQLSGGQCQRVAIARAMVGGPELLLADEPTGALDSKSGAQVMELFEQLNAEGTTVILITHDANVAARAHKIYHIFDGEIAEGGKEAGV